MRIVERVGHGGCSCQRPREVTVRLKRNVRCSGGGFSLGFPRYLCPDNSTLLSCSTNTMQRVSRMLGTNGPSQKSRAATPTQMADLPSELVLYISFFLPPAAILAWSLASRSYYTTLVTELPIKIVLDCDPSSPDDYYPTLGVTPGDTPLEIDQAIPPPNWIVVRYITEVGISHFREILSRVRQLHVLSVDCFLPSAPHHLGILADVVAKLRTRELELYWNVHLPFPINEVGFSTVASLLS
jgi:hypothetical protein